MNILITGLTLHNNKGGPALAISLIEKLKQKLDTPSFFMVVPDFENNVELEKCWAEVYGISGVMGQLELKKIIPPFSILTRNDPDKKHFFGTLRRMDLVVDLTALSYMDWPNQSFKENFFRVLSNYSMKYLAIKNRIPFIRWTQSYGPFSNLLTKMIVKKDLSSQKYIFVRGLESAECLKQILPRKNILVFPDIAITLPLDTSYIEKLISDNVIKSKYITLSPSSVLYSMFGNRHIDDMVQLITFLQKQQCQVVLVPHTLMSINPNLKNCDLKVCEEINSFLTSKVLVISEDLDVFNLKGIISKAYFHIGARYHSVIASLSTGVPTISCSWHIKYKDIMDMYGVGRFVFDAQKDIREIFPMIQNIEKDYNNIQDTIINKQKALELKINENIDLFMEMLNEMQNL